MKKAFLLSAIALISFSSFAQSKDEATKPGMRFGIRAGATFSALTTKAEILGIDMEGSTKMGTSFYVGAVVDIPVGEVLAVQTGAMFVGKGSKNLNPMYIEVPINLLVKFDTGAGKVFLGAGPYIAYGVAGKAAGETIKYGDGVMELKALDYGVNFQLGYELANGLSINGGYGLGLADINNIEVGGTKTKHGVISVGLGFNF